MNRIKRYTTAFLVLVIATFSFSQTENRDTASEREQAIIQLEKTVNRKLLALKKDMPAKHKSVWAYNILKADFKDLMSSNVELYNKVLTVKDEYQNGVKAIQEKYTDLELKKIDESYKKKLDVFYEDLKKEIASGIRARVRRRLKGDMDEKKFLTVKFEEARYLKRRKKTLIGIQKIQTKNAEELAKIKKEYEEAKKELITKRLEAQKERTKPFQSDMAKKEKEGYEKEEGWLDNFWIGIKTGVNYSTGSSSEGAKAAPGIGVMVEYTVFKIKPIAFEASIEMNINYIQKPVAIPEGTINSDYINIPIFAKGKWPANIPLGFGTLTPFIGIGIDPYMRLTSNFVAKVDGQSYTFDTKGFNLGFIWSLGGELNLLGIGTATLEFRMSLGASSGTSAYTVPLSNVDSSYQDVNVPEQKQNGYMIFVGWKMALGTLFSIF